MQSVSSRIWTCVAMSSFYDDNHYTTGTSKNRALSDATTTGQSGPGSDGSEGVLRIPQSIRITRTSLSDCLVSYNRTLGEVGWGFLPLCRGAVGVFYSPSQLSNWDFLHILLQWFYRSSESVKLSIDFSESCFCFSEKFSQL